MSCNCDPRYSEDTGLHTYRCTRCGFEGFYSYRAKVAAEIGRPGDIYHPEVEAVIEENRKK